MKRRACPNCGLKTHYADPMGGAVKRFCLVCYRLARPGAKARPIVRDRLLEALLWRAGYKYLAVAKARGIGRKNRPRWRKPKG